MHKFILFLLYLKLFGPDCTFAQITFNTTYDNSIDNDFNILNDSNGFIKVMVSFNPPYSQYIFQKIDSQGVISFAHAFGSQDDFYSIHSIVRTYDNNFAIGAYYFNVTTNKYFAFIAKLNELGDTLWTKKYPAPFNAKYYGQYILETTDKGFLITGQVVDSIDGNIFVLKTDSLGNLEWQNNFGGIKYEAGYSSVQTSDGGFLTTGWTRSFGFGNNSNRDDIVVKWDSLGNYQWHQTYGTIFNETAIGVVGLADGNYIIASGRNDLTQNQPYGKMLKIGASGNIIWQKFQGVGIDSYNWVREMSNTDLVGVCSRRVNNLDDGFVIRTDSAGNEKWRRQYRYGNSHCYFRDVQETPDGGIICAGFVFDGASGNQDGWLVKLDSTGCLFNGCGEPTGIDAISSTQYAMSIYPNPIIDEAIVKIEGLPQELLNSNFYITVYDMTGKKVAFPETGFLITETGIQFKFNRGLLQSGIYLLEITTGIETIGVTKILLN